MSHPPHAEPERCVFQHRVFATFRDAVFCRAGPGGVPVLAMTVGGQEAQLPLTALRAEFGIGEDTPDGRMLARAAASLDYVSSLRPGDTFPAEILAPAASWRPSPNHLRLAATRLRLNLVASLMPGTALAASARDELTLLRLAADPALEQAVQATAAAIARTLGLRDAAHVTALLDDLAEEFSYIEALREGLLARVERLCRRVAGLLPTQPPGSALGQVHSLGVRAFRLFRSKFDDLDAVTTLFETLARNMDGTRRFIRATRDFLVRSQHAWDPVLTNWEAQAQATADASAALVSSTYAFLAPRVLPRAQAAGRAPPPARPRSPAAAAAAAAPRAAMAW